MRLPTAPRLETSADTLRRETTAVTPVTTVTVEVGGNRAEVRGFGPQQDVLDYRNIAGMLLSDDLTALEEAPADNPPDADRASPTPCTPHWPPHCASEANVAIAENAAKKDQSGIARTFKGVVTEDYIARAGAAMKKAVCRAYWAMLAKGPVAVLATPLLYAPLDLIVRGQGQSGRMMALFGVILITFFGAVAAHYWMVQQLQKKLAPEGKPLVSRIIDRLNLTRNWLPGGGRCGDGADAGCGRASSACCSRWRPRHGGIPGTNVAAAGGGEAPARTSFSHRSSRAQRGCGRSRRGEAWYRTAQLTHHPSGWSAHAARSRWRRRDPARRKPEAAG